MWAVFCKSLKTIPGANGKIYLVFVKCVSECAFVKIIIAQRNLGNRCYFVHPFCILSSLGVCAYVCQNESTSIHEMFSLNIKTVNCYKTRTSNRFYNR